MDNTQLEIIETNELSVLKPFDVQKTELQKLANDYKNLVVTEQNYEEAIKARRVLREVRLKIAGILKENKSILNSEKSRQESKAEELTSITEPIENRIDSDIKVIDNKKEEDKKRKEAEVMAKIQQRTNKLYEMGMTFNGLEYTLGEHSIQSIQIKTFSDVEFSEFTDLVKAESLVLENRRIEEENKRKEEQVLLEKQRIEQDLERKRLEALAKEQEKKTAELKAEQDRIANEVKQSQFKAEKELRDQQETLRKQQEEFINARRKQRTVELTKIGFVYSSEESEEFTCENITMPLVDLIGTDEETWVGLISKITPMIEKHRDGRLEKAEKERLAKEDADKKERLAKEKLNKERQKILAADIEQLQILALLFVDARDNSHGIPLIDPKSIQIASDVQKMNDGIVEFIRQSIKNL